MYAWVLFEWMLAHIHLSEAFFFLPVCLYNFTIIQYLHFCSCHWSEEKGICYYARVMKRMTRAEIESTKRGRCFHTINFLLNFAFITYHFTNKELPYPIPLHQPWKGHEWRVCVWILVRDECIPEVYISISSLSLLSALTGMLYKTVCISTLSLPADSENRVKTFFGEVITDCLIWKDYFFWDNGYTWFTYVHTELKMLMHNLT